MRGGLEFVAGLVVLLARPGFSRLGSVLEGECVVGFRKRLGHRLPILYRPFFDRGGERVELRNRAVEFLFGIPGGAAGLEAHVAGRLADVGSRSLVVLLGISRNRVREVALRLLTYRVPGGHVG